MEKKRLGLMVYLYYNRDARKLAKLGDTYYHSRRLRYVLLYVDRDEADELIHFLGRQKYVKEVKPSFYHTIDRDFVGNLARIGHLDEKIK